MLIKPFTAFLDAFMAWYVDKTPASRSHLGVAEYLVGETPSDDYPHYPFYLESFGREPSSAHETVLFAQKEATTLHAWKAFVTAFHRIPAFATTSLHLGLHAPLHEPIIAMELDDFPLFGPLHQKNGIPLATFTLALARLSDRLAQLSTTAQPRQTWKSDAPLQLQASSAAEAGVIFTLLADPDATRATPMDLCMVPNPRTLLRDTNTLLKRIA